MCGALLAMTSPKKHIQKNNMKVSWIFEGDLLSVELEAPTKGWVGIGFNVRPELPGSYLLMGHVVAGKAQVMEHHTLALGDYRPITELGAEARVKHVSGAESGGKTTIRFSVPIAADSPCVHELSEGRKLTLHMAYSREDDFQHHSMMRTAVQITL